MRWPTRRSPDRPGRSPGGATRSTSTRPRASARGSTPTDRRSSSTPRPGPTSTAAPSTRSSRCVATRSRPGSSPRPAPRAASTSSSISTNEVFDGSRLDGHGYGPDDAVSPANPYGASKAAAERLAADAFAARPGAALGIARTAWLFGAPGNDFPSRILDAAERAAASGRAAPGRRRRVGDADLHGRRRRRHRRTPGR